MKTPYDISLLVVCLTALITFSCSDDDDPAQVENPADMPYNIEIDPARFISENSSLIGNIYFPLSSGTKLTYEGEDEEGAQIRVEESYTDSIMVISGVTCRVVHALEYEDDELIEDTFDWYAQDTTGNVWYFGEDTKEIEDGEVVSTEGSWKAGTDGALPGIIMFANPYSGTWYRQEYFEGEAEDVAQIISLNASASVPYGDFENCLQTAEWSPLEPGIVEHKFYAPGVGLVHVEAVKGEAGFESLVSIE